MVAPQWTLAEAVKPFSLRNILVALLLGVLAAAAAAVVVMRQPSVYLNKRPC